MTDKYIVDALQHALENVSGKTLSADSYGNIVDMLNAFNRKYVCVVTFVPADGYTIKEVTVKDTTGNTIEPIDNGVYALKAGSYKYGYDLSKIDLSSNYTKINQTLTIADSDITAGTKTVNLAAT